MHLLVAQMVVVATIALMSVADKIEFGLPFYFIIACKNAQQFPVRH